MPIFIEYDRTNLKAVRLITSDEPPEPAAHMIYQQIPDGMDVDLSLSMTEMLDMMPSEMPERTSPVSISMKQEDDTPTFLEL